MAMVIAAVWSIQLQAQGRNFAGSWTVDTDRMMAEAANAAAAGGVSGGVVGRGGGGGGVRSGGDGAAPPPQGVAAGGGGFRSGGGGGGGGVGGARGRGPAGPMNITLDSSTFTLAQGETSTAYKLDGTPTTISTPAGDATAKASWKGDRLVIETTSPTPNGPITTSVAWYLDGQSLVRETSVPAPNGELMTRKTFYKKAS
jgi:hypothetical protein